jgi:hypothetical protein
MKTYTIKIRKTVFQTCIVTAKNEEHAKQQIKEDDYLYEKTDEYDIEFLDVKENN